MKYKAYLLQHGSHRRQNKNWIKTPPGDDCDRGGGGVLGGGPSGLGDCLHGLAEEGVGLLLLPAPRAVPQQPQEPRHVHLAPPRVIRSLHSSDHHRAQHAGGDGLDRYFSRIFFFYIFINIH